MRILVTGASGFIGMNLLQYLAHAHPDATLIAADLHPPEAKPIQFLTLDVCDREACRNVLESSRPTHVVHGAAVTLTEQTASAAELTRSVNLEGTENLLRAALEVGSIQRFLLLSSSGVYKQNCDDSACDEDHPLDLSNAYAQAKRGAELLMETYEERGGFPVVAARIGPVYGLFERSGASRPGVSLIGRLVGFLRSGQAVRVAGPDVSRDWTHAEDIAAGLDGLLFAPNLNHRIYNLSAGRAVSAYRVLEVFQEKGLEVRWTGAAGADIVLEPRQNRKPLVTERLRCDTGFATRFDFRAGLADVLKEVRA
jgi:nucleoside-diphosphate-sugar epimerase